MGVFYFKIESISPGRVRFIHGENFSGILVAFAKSKLESETKSGLIAMNQALKVQAEAE